MPEFRADCDNCCGLCCVVPPQLEVQGFPVDKPAEVPCPHLDADQRCSIHAARHNQGFEACVGFDCFGAGQWVTQHLFSGAKWTDSAATAEKMFSAYRHWLPRFEAAALITAALPYVDADAKRSLTRALVELTSTGVTRPLDIADVGQLRRELLARIRSSLIASDRVTRPA